MGKSATFTASLSSTSAAASSNWSAWTRACQGSYDEGTPRVGAFLFSNLRSEIKWSRAKISKITMKLTYDKAGGNSEKTLYMYRGTKTAFTGSGTAMIGDAIGSVKTNGKAYDATRTITFDASTNAGAFANLAAWLNDDTSTTLAIYRNESSNADTYSTNYLQITAASMTVDYVTSPVKAYVNGAFHDGEVLTRRNGAWVDGEVNT